MTCFGSRMRRASTNASTCSWASRRSTTSGQSWSSSTRAGIRPPQLGMQQLLRCRACTIRDGVQSPGCEGTSRSRPVSAPEGLRAGSRRSICERRPRSGLGRLELAWLRQQAGNYPKTELNKKDKHARVAGTSCRRRFEWAREAKPTQPLTSGVWEVDTRKEESALDELQRIQLRESDLITFHNYSWPENFRREIECLKKYNRPLICTEFMARSVGSTFDTILPIAKQEHVGAINWGFVVGKTQTNMPWESWRHPYVKEPPPVWFHEVLHPDGTPYRQAEADLIRDLTGKH